MIPDFEDGRVVLEPLLVSGPTPMGKVLGVDRRAGKLGGEDFLDGGFAVEPGENDGGGLAVEESVVEAFTKEIRQAGDLSGQPAFALPGQVNHEGSLQRAAERA